MCITLLCACSYHGPQAKKDFDVTISLICDDHIRSDSETIQTVKKGELASFHLLFDEDYRFESTSFGTYQEEEQVVLVDSNYGNSTVYVKSVPISPLSLTINNNNDFGKVTINPKKNYYNYGDEVSIKVTPTNKEFLCYTFDLPYRNGLKEKSGVPISYDDELVFTLENDTVVYINYFENNSKYIEYDLNGGTTQKGKTSIKTDYKQYDDSGSFNASTINLSSYAFYEGHVLESLNTKQDGSGQRIGIGSRIDNSLYTNDYLKLYAQWKEYTNIDSFTYEKIENKEELTITGCTSNSEEIVIPAYINSQKVVAISMHAFDGLTSVKHIIFPDTIKTISDNAFINMDGVEAITLYSSLERVSSQSFDMPNLHTIHLNKNTYQLEMSYEEDNLSRYRESIINLGTAKKRVIFIGHSTIRVNHDLSPLDEKWGEDYSFFIYGASAGIHGYLLLMSIADIIAPTDYVIIPVWPTLNYSTSRNLSFLQYDFDRLAAADYQIIKDFIWTSFVDYRLTCTDEIGVSAVLPEATNYARYDKYGMNLENIPTDDVDNKSPYNYTHYLDEYNYDSFSYLDLFADSVSIPKSQIMLTWNSYNQNNIEDNSLFESFEQRIRAGFPNYTFFDTQLENIYPGNYFNKNDFMHLSSIGTAARVNRWLNELPL